MGRPGTRYGYRTSLHSLEKYLVQLLSLDIAHGLHNEAIAHTHQVDAAHGVTLTLAPAVTPSDSRPVPGHEHLFEIEMRARLDGQSLPKLKARLAPHIPRAVRRRDRIFDDTVLRDQLRQCRGVVTLKGLVKPPHYLCRLVRLRVKVFVHDSLLVSLLSLTGHLPTAPSAPSVGRQGCNWVQCKVDSGLLKEPILDFILEPF